MTFLIASKPQAANTQVNPRTFLGFVLNFIVLRQLYDLECFSLAEQVSNRIKLRESKRFMMFTKTYCEQQFKLFLGFLQSPFIRSLFHKETLKLVTCTFCKLQHKITTNKTLWFHFETGPRLVSLRFSSQHLFLSVTCNLKQFVPSLRVCLNYF